MSLGEITLGDGPNLTLVHGWGFGAQAWKPVIHALAENFTVHAVDLPGYGASPALPVSGIEALADALAETLPPRAMLCGWSLGALVCLACAARHPRKVARMVLAGATASFIARDGWTEALPAAQLADFQAQLAVDPIALLRRFGVLIHQGDVRAREAARWLRPPTELPATPQVLREGLEELASADLRAVAERITQPVLLVHGAVDPLMPQAAARRLADLLIDARIEVFEGSAHAPFASDPARFVAAVNRFAGVGE